MDAIKLLEQQHNEVETLFGKADKATTADARQSVFEEIGDALAVHATIEEELFYPAARAASTHDLLLEAVEEHLAAKRLIADLMVLPATDEHYAAKLTVLKEEIHHHIGEERKDLFPKVRKMLDPDQLMAIGEQMQIMADQLMSGAKAPRMNVPSETARAAELR